MPSRKACQFAAAFVTVRMNLHLSRNCGELQFETGVFPRSSRKVLMYTYVDDSDNRWAERVTRDQAQGPEPPELALMRSTYATGS